MKIAICDDEQKLRRQLRHFIEIHLELKGIRFEIEEYESGSALLNQAPAGQPDLLFLDIEMPGIGGMDTARALRAKGHRMLIIFITAYPDYVFEGYEVQAFHYILKPYQESKLKKVLDKALEELGAQKEHYYMAEQKSGLIRIRLSNICYFKSDRRKVCGVGPHGEETVFYGRLDDVEQKLPDFFQRIHNRYLVNLNYISRAESTRCICNQQELPVSRTYRQALAVAFAQMMLGNFSDSAG